MRTSRPKLWLHNSLGAIFFVAFLGVATQLAMPVVSLAHVGIIRTVTVSGFGIMDSMNGDYELDLETLESRIYRRRGATNFFASSSPESKPFLREVNGLWVLRSSAGHDLQHTEAGAPTPAGTYECPQGIHPPATCKTAPEPRNMVSLLAFPAPTQFLFGFYQYHLLRRHDLVMLRAGCRGERVPAVYLKTPGAKMTVLYSHGNAEDLGLIIDHLTEFGRLVCSTSICTLNKSQNFERSNHPRLLRC